MIDFSVEDTLNNFFYQYSPFYDEKSSTIYFTARKGDRLFDDENIFTVRYKDRKTSGALPFEFLNSENNEGTISLSQSGDYLVFSIRYQSYIVHEFMAICMPYCTACAFHNSWKLWSIIITIYV